MSSINSNIQKFLALLGMADAVTVDDGALLTGWEKEDLTGEANNTVATFEWTDGDGDFSEELTEGGITEGEFHSDGKFVAKNADGETTVIRFFQTKPLTEASLVEALDLNGEEAVLKIRQSLAAMWRGQESTDETVKILATQVSKEALANFIVDAFNRQWISVNNLGIGEDGYII